MIAIGWVVLGSAILYSVMLYLARRTFWVSPTKKNAYAYAYAYARAPFSPNPYIFEPLTTFNPSTIFFEPLRYHKITVANSM
jgi:hypothetical protein